MAIMRVCYHTPRAVYTWNLDWPWSVKIYHPGDFLFGHGIILAYLHVDFVGLPRCAVSPFAFWVPMCSSGNAALCRD